MQSSKLLTLISGLDASEFRWLHKFLKSPFYNTNEKLLRLFEYVKKYYPDLASPKLAKEITFQYLFPKEKFAPQKMRKLMHELATLVEDYMVAQHFQKNKFARKKILTKELGHRNLYGLFEKGTTEITADLAELPYRDKDYFLEQYLNDYQFFVHPSTNPQQGFIPKLFQMSDTLDQFYFLQKLQLNGVLESAKHIYQVEAGLPFFETIQQKVKGSNLNEIPVIQLYALVNQLFQQQDSEEIFNQLYTAFFENKNKLGEADKESILKYLINFTLQKVNRGQSDYVKLGLRLYKIGLSENLLITSNRITENTFTNIVLFGCFLNDFDFTRKFIKTYQQFLDERRRSEIVLLSESNLCFASENYSKVIDLLGTSSFVEVLYKLRAKILLIKSYFELYLKDDSYQNLVLSQTENFERNIRREEKISDHKKINYLNFTKYLKILVRAKVKREDITGIKSQLITLNSVSNKPWLLNKIVNFY